MSRLGFEWPPTVGFRHVMEFAGIGAIVALIPVYAVYLRQPSIGYFHDDGIYVINALSLESGDGYRTVSLPDAPFQTKYPILYAGILATAWRAIPSLPEKIHAFKVISLLSTGVWALLVFDLVRRQIGSRAVRIWICAAMLSSTWVIFLSTTVLPDTLFACLSTAVLLVLEPEQNRPPAIAKVIFAAVLCGATILLRSAGLPLMAACFCFLAMRNRKRSALFVGVCLAVVLPWLIWQGLHPGLMDRVESYYTKVNYQGGQILALRSVWKMAVLVVTNLIGLTSTICPVAGLHFTFVAFLTNVLAAALALIGGVVCAYRKILLLPVIWALFYCGMLLCWIGPPARYAAPLVPIALMFGYAGLLDIAKRLRMSLRRPAVAMLSACALSCVAVTCLFLNVRHLREAIAATINSEQPSFNGTLPDKWSSIVQLSDWIRTKTPQNAVVGSDSDPVLFLLTGRKSVRLSAVNLFELFYDDASNKLPLGPPEKLRTDLVAHKISYIVMTPRANAAEAPFLERQLASVINARPQAFRVALKLKEPGYYILAVDRNRL